jgi:hypothetical protein
MLRSLLLVLHAVLGLSAIGAGQALVRKPDGRYLRFDTAWLKRSPFPDYRLPGLFLMGVIGSGNLAAAVAQWRRGPLAAPLSVANGFLLVVWLTIQTAIIGYRHWSQLIWAVVFPAVALLAALQLRIQSGKQWRG